MFVILEHTTGPSVHWDFMIERHPGGPLATWRLASNPLVDFGPIDATPIADHRREYLEYEGAISGGRGSVSRIDRGAATIHELTTKVLRATLDGDRIRGQIEIATHGKWRQAGIADI